MIYSKKKIILKGQYHFTQFISDESIELQSPSLFTGENLIMVIGKASHIRNQSPVIQINEV